ncbi:hypothetical protein G173_gp103 [Erwinia phage phiEaH2]|nr:hypothetical protein G173_gp103 [Erwinia phage phiEaH2]AFQ96648.1 hypothetical protein [Erwinia phage phiEaH2]
MELIIADRAGKTVERYRVIYCSQALDDVMHFVAYPDGYVIPISREIRECKVPLTATILALNIATQESRRFEIGQYKLLN